ncbi:MAG: negative regulator of MalT activity/cystathionine beta-lyase [Sodalis sp. Psp]|nr:negative regulator of MalT activity/cystathionine beta-lyase [Sodalis sp. Psp]MCR3756968.1 negative regulator of MalT activity/cystathionine beta-lyase [Sodalis sp. Ppy]
MVFNFDECIDRRHSDSYKWQKYAGRDVIPLWVADTDFRSPPCIIEALCARIEHGVFGYGTLPAALTEIFIKRMHERYQWDVRPEWLIFLPGLVSGLHLTVRALTSVGEAIVIPYPSYPPFRTAARSAGRQHRLASMRLVSSRWCVDFSGTDPVMTGKESLLMLCNPHNPGGTAYRRGELEQHLDFARQHDLLVCSDEIHCDLLLTPDVHHIPFASLSEDAAQRSITLMSPSKTFNIAGLGASVAVIPNAHLRMQFAAARAGIVPMVDVLALTAANAAWQDGQDWLTQQLDYLRGNRDRLTERLRKIPGLMLSGPEATYLAWIDASRLAVADPHAFFERAGVGLSAGAEFGDNRFVRLNFGCTRALLEEALDRMELACEHICQ